MKTKKIKALFKRPRIKKQFNLLKLHLVDLAKDLDAAWGCIPVTEVSQSIKVTEDWRWSKVSGKFRIDKEIINMIESLDQINYKRQYDKVINDLRIINDSLDYIAKYVRQWENETKFVYLEKCKKVGFKKLNPEEKEYCEAAILAIWNLRKGGVKPMLKAIESLKDCHI